MNKQRIVSALLALAFLTLAGCQTSQETPPRSFFECNCNSGP